MCRTASSEEYLRNFQVEQITPMPDAVEARDGMLVYTFRGQPREVAFNLKAKKIGMVAGRAGGADKVQILSFKQFIYP